MKASDVMFEFSNPLRVQILAMLVEERLRLSDIAKNVDVTTAEVSRHLDRMTKAGIINKEDGKHTLTQYGQILLCMFGSWSKIVDNEEFYAKHFLDSIPSCLRNLVMVSDTKLSSGLFENLGMSKSDSEQAEGYIYGMCESIFPQTSEVDLKRAGEGLQVRMIFSSTKDVPQKYRGVENFDVRLLKDVPFWLKLTDKTGVIAFYKEGNLDFGEVMVADTKDAKCWMTMLFEHFWNSAKPFGK